jgi:hypothetical protein
VQAVDFQAWPDWETYYRAVSANVRRNVQKARKAFPDLATATRRGKAAYREFLPLQIARHKLFRRKGVRRAFASVATRAMLRLMFMDSYAAAARCRGEGRDLAHYLEINFGANTFYLEVASAQRGDGAAWHLLMTMMEAAFRRSAGRGKFVMGPDDGAQRGDPVWEGLARSRRQCRAAAFPTSVVSFSYAMGA